MAKRKSNFDLLKTVGSMQRMTESTLSARRAEEQVATVAAGRGHTITVDDSCCPETAIAHFMQDLRGLIDQKGFGAEIEVELRFGRITSCLQDARCRPSHEGLDAAVALTDEQMKSLGAKFVPGVAANEFPMYRHVVDKMLKSDAYAQQLEKQVVHNMAHSKRIIEDIDLNTSARSPPQVQVKERLGSMDIFLPKCPYDCRISISCEFPRRELNGSLSEMPAAEAIRHRDRVSAIGRDLRVDLTKVLEENTDRTTYELEAELDAGLVQNWLKEPDEQHQSWKSASQAASLLWKIAKMFMPEAGQAFKRSWNSIGDDAQRIQDAYFRYFNVPRNSFPGTMPVGFARWHIPRVRERQYFVSEKTDGVRYFLVAAGESVVLVDRTNSAFTTSGLDMLRFILPEGTVLDGEFVFHQGEGRYIFLAFDVIATGPSQSDCQAHKSFEERFRALENFLVDQYSTRQRQEGIPDHAILRILKKKWLPMNRIADVFRQIQRVIKKHDQSMARIYQDDKRKHYTDGVVFCPNSEYKTRTCETYLKWKWVDQITIDFLVSFQENNALSLKCGGPRNTDVDVDSIVQVDPKDYPHLQKIVQRSASQSAVIEFSFSPERGLWNFKCHRPDKDTGNYIRTVLGSLMNMAEAISQEELQFRLLASHGEQWDEFMKGARRNILEKSRR